VPVTFANFFTVTVRAPDGNWYEVRIVPDDGHRAWPQSLSFGRTFFIFDPLNALYRLVLRCWYSLRRSTKQRVEVIPWANEGSPPPDRARPLIRELHPDMATARIRAAEHQAAISQGDLHW